MKCIHVISAALVCPCRRQSTSIDINRHQSVLIRTNPAPPHTVQGVMKLAPLFIKQKLLDRIKLVNTDHLIDLYDASQLPLQYGGTYTTTYMEWRENSLKTYRASVAAVEAGGASRAATVSM